MEKDRLSQYRRKIDIIVEKLEKLPEEPEGLLVDAVLYGVQVSIDAMIDITAMLVRDSGEEVSDDYYNIDKLVDIKLIDKEFAEKIKQLNGLRNAIVHKYNKFEENEVIDNIEEIKETIYLFLEKIENAIKRFK